MHSESEHTVNGEHTDLEMHTVHYPSDSSSGIIAAAFGIMFSVNDYTASLTWAEEKIIDAFFEGLKWDIATTDATEITSTPDDEATEDVDESVNSGYPSWNVD